MTPVEKVLAVALFVCAAPLLAITAARLVIGALYLMGVKHYRRKAGEPPHGEVFVCEECGDDVSGYHAEQVAADGPAIWLCPTCAEADRPRDAATQGRA